MWKPSSKATSPPSLQPFSLISSLLKLTWMNAKVVLLQAITLRRVTWGSIVQPCSLMNLRNRLDSEILAVFGADDSESTVNESLTKSVFGWSPATRRVGPTVRQIWSYFDFLATFFESTSSSPSLF